MITNFTVVERNPRYPGLTGEYDDPKIESYKYIAMLQAQGRTTSTTVRADGSITVESAGLEPMTFIGWQSRNPREILSQIPDINPAEGRLQAEKKAAVSKAEIGHVTLETRKKAVQS
jgi:hypothetical protein